MISHPIPPVYNEQSKVLILGSFPSVKSREKMFFYGHKQNRFWKVISAVTESDLPTTICEKKDLLLRSRIALWDVIESCDISGSADSTIKNVKPNDISTILSNSDIKMIFLNGRTAEKYYNKYTKQSILRDAVCLPSTSAANASWSTERLIDSWMVLKKYLNS